MTKQDVKIRTSTPYAIQFSTTSDRASPTDLQDAIVSGAIYMMVTPTTGVSSVTFYVDPADGPYRTDSSAPFDFDGNAGAAALPTDTVSYFGEGDHLVFAVLTMSNGNCLTLASSFKVAAGSVGADPYDRMVLTATIGTPTIGITGNQTVHPSTVSRTVTIQTPGVATSSASSALGDNNSYVEPRLLTDPNVKFIWNMNNPAGALATIGGSGGDSSNNGGSLATIRFFENAPATFNGFTIGNCERLRFPVPGEGGSEQTNSLTYGEYCRRRFTTLGLAASRDLYFRYAVYLPSNFDPATGGKLPALISIPDSQSLSGYLSSNDVYNEDSWYAGIMWNGPSSLASFGGSYTGDSNLDHIRFQSYIYAKQIQGTTYTQAAVTGGLRGYALKARAGLNQDPSVANSGGSTVTGSGAYLYMNRGAWNTVEQHVSMNDSGVANGTYRLWMNGTLGLNIQNIKWANDTYNSTAIINGLQFNTFFGGPYGSSSTQTLYKGEYVLSSAAIGTRR